MSHDLPSQQRHESTQLDVLRAAGYVVDFEIGRSGLAVSGGDPVPVGDIHIDGEYRFEGASNPDDESLVMALHDDVSGRLGVLITAFHHVSAVEADPGGVRHSVANALEESV